MHSNKVQELKSSRVQEPEIRALELWNSGTLELHCGLLSFGTFDLLNFSLDWRNP
jgi:hypothetical protein